MNIEALEATAKSLAAQGKGILAADESAPTIKKRLAAINVEATAENSRAWREIVFTIPRLNEAVSGIILFDETLRQNASDGRRFVDVEGEHEPLLEVTGAADGDLAYTKTKYEGRRMRVSDLLDNELLVVGDELVWLRPKNGERYEASSTKNFASSS